MRWLSTPWKVLLLLAPTVVFFTVFVAYPVAYSVWYSFTDFLGFGTANFVGFGNYTKLFTDPLFWLSLRNTGVVLAVSVFVVIPVAFLLALLLRKPFRGAGLLRALIFAPGIFAPILIGLVWVFILDPSVGLLNGTFSALGLSWSPQWIGGSSVLSAVSIAVVFAWSTVGFAMTILYAGLQVVPADVMEASSLDGATWRQQNLFVVLPMMRQTMAITTVLVVTNALKIFELVYQLTGGGPVHKSEVLVSYMYFITFSGQEYGRGMAFAVVITLLGGIASLGYLLILRRQRGVLA